jgi:hypothetical protein
VDAPKKADAPPPKAAEKKADKPAPAPLPVFSNKNFSYIYLAG